MIISHEHRFIFIKTRKTAGSSVEAALAGICGPDDILTPDGPHGVPGDDRAPYARNFTGKFLPLRELASCRDVIDIARVARDFSRWPKFYNHMRASSVRARISPKIWNNYYKFCFDRNPWDKTISFFFWIQRHQRKYKTLDDYLFDDTGYRTTDRHYPSDWSRYTFQNRVIVDDVFRFEDLEGSLKTALRNCGVGESVLDTLVLPREKGAVRNRGEELTFTRKGFEKVSQVFEREIDYFGYECPEKFLAKDVA